MIHSPKVLYGIKTVNLMQNILVMAASFALFFLFVMTERINIPKSPSKNIGSALKSYLLVVNFMFFLVAGYGL